MPAVGTEGPRLLATVGGGSGARQIAASWSYIYLVYHTPEDILVGSHVTTKFYSVPLLFHLEVTIKHCWDFFFYIGRCIVYMESLKQLPAIPVWVSFYWSVVCHIDLLWNSFCIGFLLLWIAGFICFAFFNNEGAKSHL